MNFVEGQPIGTSDGCFPSDLENRTCWISRDLGEDLPMGDLAVDSGWIRGIRLTGNDRTLSRSQQPAERHRDDTAGLCMRSRVPRGLGAAPQRGRLRRATAPQATGWRFDRERAESDTNSDGAAVVEASAELAAAAGFDAHRSARSSLDDPKPTRTNNHEAVLALAPGPLAPRVPPPTRSVLRPRGDA
jgi:hypothetical protein